MSTHCLLAAKDYWGTVRGVHTALMFKNFLLQHQIAQKDNIRELLNDALTTTSFIYEYRKILEKLSEENTTVIVVMIGHGNQFADIDGDEDDGKDEGYHLPDGVVLDDHLTSILIGTSSHPSSKLVLISDHCSSGTMLDVKNCTSKRWVTIASSLPHEDSLATGDGNVMLCSLMNFLKVQDNLKRVTVMETKLGLEKEMFDNWGELQHPNVYVSDPSLYHELLFP